MLLVETANAMFSSLLEAPNSVPDSDVRWIFTKALDRLLRCNMYIRAYTLCARMVAYSVATGERQLARNELQQLRQQLAGQPAPGDAGKLLLALVLTNLAALTGEPGVAGWNGENALELHGIACLRLRECFSDLPAWATTLL